MYSKDEIRMLRKDFWASFDRYTKYYAQQLGEPIHWIMYKTEIPGLDLKFDVQKKYVAVVLELNHRSEDKRFNAYVELDAFRKLINQGFEEEPIWEEEYELEEGKVVSRIFVDLERVSYHNRDNWPQIFKFMASNMYTLQSNFLDIKPILKERLS